MAGWQSAGHDKRIVALPIVTRTIVINALIHTCELDVNPFDYLTELQRHAQKLATSPAEWMPWNYRETLKRIVSL